VVAKNNLSESDLPMLRDFIVKLKQAEAKLGAEGQDSILFDDSDIVHQLISNGSELEFYKDDEKIESADDKEKIEHFQPAVREKRESASFKFEITKDDLLKSAIIVLLIVIYICLMLRLF
jgi:regulatory protein YycH of two-component signal transduction system YycFG